MHYTNYTIREYGHVAASGDARGTDFVPVGQVTFERLKALAVKTADIEKPLLRFSSSHGQETLQVLNYVGVLGIDHSTQLEVLPKTSTDPASASDARDLLWKMLNVVTNVSPQENAESALSTLPNSWLESLTTLVLQKVSLLIRRGIKRDYARRKEHSAFLKGQLQVAKQMRARPGTEHRFHVSYDQYLPDRAENRLLKSTLIRLNHWASTLDNKRLCSEFLFALVEIPESRHIEGDLRDWRNDRGMAHYQPLLPWVRLILNHQSPVFSSGALQGISLLFPMEKLFEDYVFKLLSTTLSPGYRLQTQAASQHLLIHKGAGLFKLKPDGVVSKNGCHHAVLDTKWKLLDERLGDARDKYALSQADFYQMFAYGRKYLDDNGELFLIYPGHPHFTGTLECFEFDKNLRLWVVPFDMKTGQLIFTSTSSTPDWLSSKQAPSGSPNLRI
jgi:5-methylcytosine-specific restriction enzyme subunit McrC